MSDDFTKYSNMKDTGNTPLEVYAKAVNDGLDPITRIRMIRSVFSFSLGEAKQVVMQSENAGEAADTTQKRIAHIVSESLKPHH